MRIIAHILILAFIVSLYVSYCQWQCSHYYLLSAAMEQKKDHYRTVIFAAKASKANPFDDKPLHLLSKGLLEQGHLQPGIAILTKVLIVRPHKKYLLRNLRQGMAKLKSVEKK